MLDFVSNEMRRFEFSASSEIDTRPRCVINFPTASNSSCEIKMNLPRSSITPEEKERKKIQTLISINFDSSLKI